MGAGWVRIERECRDGDGDLLYDFEAKAFEGWDVQWGVAEQTNTADAEVEEDLAAESYSAQGAAVVVFMRFGVGAGALVGVGDEAG